MIEIIKAGEQTLGMIVPLGDEKNGVDFFTPPESSLQLASMRHKAGSVISAHYHNKITRQVSYTQEVLIIRRGSLRVDFYDNQQNYVKSRILKAGEVVLLVGGGHGFEALEELEMIEVKQGPFMGEEDKTRFSGITNDQAVFDK